MLGPFVRFVGPTPEALQTAYGAPQCRVALRGLLDWWEQTGLAVFGTPERAEETVGLIQQYSRGLAGAWPVLPWVVERDPSPLCGDSGSLERAHPSCLLLDEGRERQSAGSGRRSGVFALGSGDSTESLREAVRRLFRIAASMPHGRMVVVDNYALGDPKAHRPRLECWEEFLRLRPNVGTQGTIELFCGVNAAWNRSDVQACDVYKLGRNIHDRFIAVQAVVPTSGQPQLRLAAVLFLGHGIQMLLGGGGAVFGRLSGTARTGVQGWVASSRQTPWRA